MVSIRDVLEGKVPEGEEVVLTGEVVDLLPLIAVGDISYGRLRITDGKDSIVVMIQQGSGYYLPSDVLEVRGKVRPCPFMLSLKCVETDPDMIKIKGWKYVSPEDRGSVERLGPFYLKYLLFFTSTDRKVVDVLLKTGLEPLKVLSLAKEMATKGEDMKGLVDAITAMVAYSYFLKDLEAANTTNIITKLLMGDKTLPDKFKEIIDPLDKMISIMVSAEGLRVVVEPSPSMIGLVKLYPTASPEELDDVSFLRPLVERLIDFLKEGASKLIILEIMQKELIPMVRKMGELIPGLGESPLYYLAVPSLESSEAFGEAVSKLIKLGDEMEGKSVVYLEFPEILVPSDTFLSTANVPDELKMMMYMMRKDVVESLNKVLEKGSVVLVITMSATYISEDLLEKADKVYRVTASGIIDITESVKQQ